VKRGEAAAGPEISYGSVAQEHRVNAVAYYLCDV